MSATIEVKLPDALVEALGTNMAELPRKALEALAAQSYRDGKLTHAQVGEALGLDRWQTDGFLKGARAHRSAENTEFAADLEKLRNISK
jgi:hypothetical protein